VLWSALHGMSLLERAGRMRPEDRDHRIADLVTRFGGAGQPADRSSAGPR
jgi:hypothetical protein